MCEKHDLPNPHTSAEVKMDYFTDENLKVGKR